MDREAFVEEDDQVSGRIAPPMRTTRRPGRIVALGPALVVLAWVAAAVPATAPPPDDWAKALLAVDRHLDTRDDDAADRIVAALAQRDPKRAEHLGDYLRGRRLHARFQRGHARLDVRLEVARQAETVYRTLLNRGPAPALMARGRLHLALLLQERARSLLEFNSVLYAVEIDEDLIGSAALCRAVFNTPANRLLDEDGWIRAAAELEQWIDLYYRARLYSIEDARREPALREALLRLDVYAERHAGTLGEWRAFLFSARCLELYGDLEGARERYRDLLPTGAQWWTAETLPLLEVASLDFCRLARRLDEDGAGARAASQCVTILDRHVRRIGRPPTPTLAKAMGEAALARARWAPTADAQFADLDRTAARFADEAPDARRALAPFALQLFVRTSDPSPRRTPHACLLAADGLLRNVEPVRALRLAMRVARVRTLAASLRAEAWILASRAWGRRDFEREAALAASHAGTFDRSETTRRRIAALWTRVARRTNAAADVARADRARATLPQVAGSVEHRAGMDAYRRGDFAEALAWLERVDRASPYYALAVAHAGYTHYLATPTDDLATARTVLASLEQLDRLPADSPNLLPALALARLTRALAYRRLGDLKRARTALDGIETAHGESQTALVAEALTLRLAIELEHADAASAGRTLAAMETRYPLHRALGEASLLLGRHLRRVYAMEAQGGGISAGQRTTLRRSLTLRRRARDLLKNDFHPRDRYALGVDELALGRPDRALKIFERLLRRSPAELAESMDAIRLERARCLTALDRDAEALAAVDDILTRRPAHLAPLKLRAILLGGSVRRARDGAWIVKRRLGRPRDANRIWERILDHASTGIPYRELWFEAQFHRALMRLWAGRPDFARRLIHIVRIDYPEFGGGAARDHLAWLDAELGR